MKKELIITLFSALGIFIQVSYSQSDVLQDISSNLQGEYLGQEPPGETPELFAPGIISTSFITDAGAGLV